MRPRIPDDELRFRTSRASGPGGQHVNRTETRVEVLWDAAHSPSLTAQERARVCAALASRIGQEGVLRVVAADERSQHRNKEIAAARLRALVEQALRVPRRRRPTRPSRAAQERRLTEKKRRGALKRTRGRAAGD